MRESARYVNHLGKSIELNSGDIHISTGTLADWLYSYDVLSGRPSGFAKDCKEKPIGAIVVGYETRNALHDVAVVDIAAEEPGALWVGDWSMSCYIVGLAKDRTWLGPAADYTLSILPDGEPVWTCVHEYEFAALAAGGGMDFDYDFDYDFGSEAVSETRLVSNPSALPAPITLTVYGPALNPVVSIAGNDYAFEVDVETGGRLVVDGTRKSITLIDRWGAEQNAFGTRRGVQRAGSGSYAFQRVPHGTHALLCQAGVTVGVRLFETRDEWRWEQHG